MNVRTARLYAAALATLLSLAAPSAFGLDEIGVEFGNAPFRGGPSLTSDLLSILNDTHRVYLFHIQSDGFKSFIAGYFQGDTAAANDALRRFAALEKGLDVVLLPGPREVTSFGGKRKVSATEVSDTEVDAAQDGRVHASRLPASDGRRVPPESGLRNAVAERVIHIDLALVRAQPRYRRRSRRRTA